MFDWTDDRCRRAAELWAGGATAAAIKLELGAPSRNAVSGKLSRMGLLKAGPQARGLQKRKPPTQRYVFGSAVPLKRVSVSRAPSLPQADLTEPVPLLVNLLDLEPNQCRWMYGEGPFLSCGHLVEKGKSYCPHHQARSYRRNEA